MTNLAQPTIIVEKFFHHEHPCLALKFDYDEDLIKICKQILARWSPTHQCWYVQEKDVKLAKIFQAFKGKAWVDASALYGGNKPKPQTTTCKKPDIVFSQTTASQKVTVPDAFESLLKRRRYSESTVRTYISFFKKFMIYFHPKSLNDISDEDIKGYLLYLVEKRKVSHSTQNQAINAIKFYYEQVLRQEKQSYWIDRPKKPSRIPHILSKEEIARMLRACDNLKHYTIIAIIYSAGLRRSELLKLRVRDIDFNRNQLYIRGGKGQKDRVSLLSETLKPTLQKYLNEYKPHYWFVEGTGRKPYSATSVRQVVLNAAKKAKIDKKVSPHILRHSFATHLMDSGIDTRQIQKLLGHNSILTTSIYTHVSDQNLQKIKSPIDQILPPK